jgi:hypothetical protein
MRERSRSGTYFLGLRRVAFLAALAWTFALSLFGLPPLPASASLAAAFLAFSFFAALRGDSAQGD